MKKKNIQRNIKRAISIYPFWVIGDLMVNYMEIQDFVELSCISLLRYTGNDTGNVLESWENVLEKFLENCLNFFFWKSVLTIIPIKISLKFVP